MNKYVQFKIIFIFFSQSKSCELISQTQKRLISCFEKFEFYFLKNKGNYIFQSTSDFFINELRIYSSFFECSQPLAGSNAIGFLSAGSFIMIQFFFKDIKNFIGIYSRFLDLLSFSYNYAISQGILYKIIQLLKSKQIFRKNWRQPSMKQKPALLFLLVYGIHIS